MPLKTIFSDELIEQYTKQGYWGSGTLLDYFERNAAAFPEREYVIDAKERVSFARMSEIANNIAGRLMDFGFKKEDRIAVMLPNWAEFFSIHYALEKIGAIGVPILMNLREWEIEYILNTTEAVGMVMPGFFNKFDYAKMMGEMKQRVPSLNYIFVIGDTLQEGMFSFACLREEKPKIDYGKDTFDQVRTADGDVYLIGMTSGTTARPKLYLYTENGYVNAASIIKDRLKVTEDDVMMAIPPITQGFGRCLGFAIPTITGCRSVQQEKFDPAISLQLIEKERVSILAAVPTQSIKMLNQPEMNKADLSSLRVILHAGALLPYAVAREVEERFGCKVLNCYAASDGPRVSCTSLDDPAEVRYATVGKPFPGHRVKIIGKDGRELASGEIGEIRSRGPSISAGYYKENPEIMQETFLEDGWFRHGDLAMMREDGNIVIGGRIRDLIIRGGQNIAPKEIEDLLSLHPKVKDIAVAGIPDRILGERACAFVVPANLEDPLTFDEMTDYLTRHKLAKFKFPELLEIIEDFPTVGAGKIDKKSLIEKVIEKITNHPCPSLTKEGS